MKRSRVLIVVVLAGLAPPGCARKPPVAALTNRQPAAATANAAGEQVAWVPLDADGLRTVYQGKSATQWADQLNSKNHQARASAGEALAKLGPEGFPHLLEGMRSKTPEVQLSSLIAVDKPDLVKNKDSTMPILLRMLRDPEPMIRRSAAARVCWFGAEGRAALPELRQMAAADPVPDIRQVAAVSVEIISNPNADRVRGDEKDRPANR